MYMIGKEHVSVPPVVPAGTEGEGPFGLLPAISAAQQVDRQLSTAQAGASPSEASTLASP